MAKKFVFVILPLVLAVTPALAGELSASEALETLAYAKSADSHCRILSAGERAEFLTYDSRARAAASRLVSAQDGVAAASVGNARGAAAPCNDATARDVRDTLVAAREAVAAADGRTAQSAAKPGTKKIEKPRGESKPVGLDRYAKLIKPYYADLRCRNLSKSQATQYWRAIIRLQSGMVKKFGTSAVASAQADARRGASSMSCSKAAQAAASALDDIRG